MGLTFAKAAEPAKGMTAWASETLAQGTIYA